MTGLDQHRDEREERAEHDEREQAAGEVEDPLGEVRAADQPAPGEAFPGEIKLQPAAAPRGLERREVFQQAGTNPAFSCSNIHG
jgi:hypothetical protein